MYKFRYSIWFGEDKIHEEEMRVSPHGVLIGRAQRMHINLAPERLRELAVKAHGPNWKWLSTLEEEAEKVSKVHGTIQVDKDGADYNHIGRNDAFLTINLPNNRARSIALSSISKMGRTQIRLNASRGFEVNLRGLGKGNFDRPSIRLHVGKIERTETA